MSVVSEYQPRSGKGQRGVPALLLVTLLVYLVLIPAVHPVHFGVPFTPYTFVAYWIYKENGSPWSWTPDPHQGFGHQSRMIVSFQGHDAYTFRIGPLVYEWQHGWGMAGW